MNNIFGDFDIVTASFIAALPEDEKPMFEYKAANMHFWPIFRQVESCDRPRKDSGKLTDEDKERLRKNDRPEVRNDEEGFERWLDSILPWCKRKNKVRPEDIDFSGLEKALADPEFIKLMPEKWKQEKRVEVVELSKYNKRTADTTKNTLI